jgi:2-polyprenyl-3-methyl-5-hydroxy-6-metoxy-1,4-benzoquinol methylase
MHLPAPEKTARVIDVGCGSGVLLARMKRLGWEVEGTDVDAGAVKATQARGIRCTQGDLSALNFPADHFDAVHSSHMLEHVSDPLALLRECHRILKPNGRFVCLTPNVTSWGHHYFGPSWLCLDPPRHLHLFTPVAIRKAAEQAGFSIIRLETTARTAWVYGAMSFRIRKTSRSSIAELNNPLSLLKGIAYQLRQRAALRWNATAGDELLLVATKS